MCTPCPSVLYLPDWVTYYNTERTHTALGGITPKEALLNNLHGNHI